MNKNSDITEIFGPDFSKKARAYQKGREKEKTPEHLQWQKEAAVYLRISSEMQKEGFSLEAQMRDCTKYIESVGYHLSEENIFIDEAFTAKDENRPAFKKLIISAFMGHFSLIVTHKESGAAAYVLAELRGFFQDNRIYGNEFLSLAEANEKMLFAEAPGDYYSYQA